jgi:integrase/recombinase XerD
MVGFRRSMRGSCSCAAPAELSAQCATGWEPCGCLSVTPIRRSSISRRSTSPVPGPPGDRAVSRTAYFSAIRAFFVWYANNGGADVTARLPRPRSPQSTPRPVSTERLRRLLNTRMHHRTQIMILLAALAGLRVHEVAKVRGEDVDINERTLRVTGKGGRSDPLHPLLVAAALTMPTRGWWFPANSRRRGEHVHAKSVSDIIGQAMRRAGTVGTPHALRHWYGSNLVATGADLRTAQTLLRHANLQTTAIYIAVADQKRSEAVDRLNPYG